MNGFALVLVTAALGVDYGWQPGSDGRLEYIIQLEPVTLIALRQGQEAVSQIDPYLKNVRRFRIQVGSDMVPRVGNPTTGGELPANVGAAQASPPGVNYGWQPVDAQNLEFIVQLSPERIVLLKSGEDVVGEIPPEVASVYRIRVRSGSGPLPRVGLGGFGAQSSGVALAGAEDGRSTVRTAGGAQAPQPPTTRGSSFPILGTTGAGASGTGTPGVPSQSTPAIAGPPRMTSPTASDASPPAPPSGNGAAAPYQPSQGPSLGTQAGNPPTPGQAKSSQSDSRTIYAQGAGQPGTSGRSAHASGAATGPGGSWQQPPAQADSTGGWSAAVDNAQSWPPATSASVQGASQASSGTRPSWNPDSAPSDSYAGSQRRGVSQPTGLGDTSIRREGSSYSPFASTGPPPGAGSLSHAGTDGTFAPHGADMVSIVSLSSRQPKKASPMDFWNSLAETANDPELAYLRDDGQSDPEEAWWPLTLAMLALFASMGGNLYMGWIAVDVYRRYLDAAGDEYDEDDDASLDSEDDREDDWTRERGRRRERATSGERAVA